MVPRILHNQKGFHKGFHSSTKGSSSGAWLKPICQSVLGLWACARKHFFGSFSVPSWPPGCEIEHDRTTCAEQLSTGPYPWAELSWVEQVQVPWFNCWCVGLPMLSELWDRTSGDYEQFGDQILLLMRSALSIVHSIHGSCNLSRILNPSMALMVTLYASKEWAEIDFHTNLAAFVKWLAEVTCDLCFCQRWGSWKEREIDRHRL